MKEMEELFHIQSVKERCLNDLEKARMEMAYIESFRHLPSFAAPQQRHHHHSAAVGNNIPPSTASSQQQRPLSNSGRPQSTGGGGPSVAMHQPPPQQAEIPRLLQATATNGHADSSAPSGTIAKQLLQSGRKSAADQDYAPLLGKLCYTEILLKLMLGLIVVQETADIVVPGLNPASLTVNNPDNRQGHCVCNIFIKSRSGAWNLPLR